MKKEINIPWEKAPKRVKGLAHVFVEFHDIGYWIFWWETSQGWADGCELSGVKKPDWLDWKKSFTPYPGGK